MHFCAGYSSPCLISAFDPSIATVPLVRNALAPHGDPRSNLPKRLDTRNLKLTIGESAREASIVIPLKDQDPEYRATYAAMIRLSVAWNQK